MATQTPHDQLQRIAQFHDKERERARRKVEAWTQRMHLHEQGYRTARDELAQTSGGRD
jgi:ABC-type uncharacterized transport system ATPase subunit